MLTHKHECPTIASVLAATYCPGLWLLESRDSSVGALPVADGEGGHVGQGGSADW